MEVVPHHDLERGYSVVINDLPIVAIELTGSSLIAEETNDLAGELLGNQKPLIGLVYFQNTARLEPAGSSYHVNKSRTYDIAVDLSAHGLISKPGNSGILVRCSASLFAVLERLN